MELSTTTRGKAKLLWNGYTKHTEKNDTIRWHCTCRASKHCPASAYTDLLPAYPVLKTDHNHCPEPVKLEVDSSRMEMHICAAASNDPPSCIYADNITALTGAAKAILPNVDMCKFFTEMSCYRNVLLPKCQLPKRPLPKCPLPKCLDTSKFSQICRDNPKLTMVWLVGFIMEYALSGKR